jgi:hypothetical protein
MSAKKSNLDSVLTSDLCASSVPLSLVVDKLKAKAQPPRPREHGGFTEKMNFAALLISVANFSRLI